MKIKDLTTGKIFTYGSDKHHALVISDDGSSLRFEHLQNGGGSGEYGTYCFVDDNDEIIPCETEQSIKYGADSYFNIGGFKVETETNELSKNTVAELYQRTLNNCKYYEKEKMYKHLLNEIGVLRGIAYVLESIKECPHSKEFMYYIQKQEELKSNED